MQESELIGRIKKPEITKETLYELHKDGWSRGARTDKGVHALCNAIAVKLQISKELLKDSAYDSEVVRFNKLEDKKRVDILKVVNLINSNLPADIRVYTLKLVTQGFDVRKMARSRIYEYIAPYKWFNTG